MRTSAAMPCDLLRRQAQPVERRVGQAGVARPLDVLRVRGEDLVLPRDQRLGDRLQGAVLHVVERPASLRDAALAACAWASNVASMFIVRTPTLPR